MTSPPTAIDFLNSTRWYVQLEESAQTVVKDTAGVLHIAAGAYLCQRGDRPLHWYGIMDGLMKWSVNSSDGKTINLAGMSKGAWFGEGSLLRRERDADIVALRESQIVYLPFDTFDWLYNTQIVFNHFLLAQINERLHWYMGNHAAHLTLNVDKQVARALTGLFHPWLNPGTDSYLKLSQEELANLSGVSRPRCNEALAHLKRVNLVKTDYGGIRVLDLEGLRNFASGVDRPANALHRVG